MKRTKLIVLLAVLAMVVAACGGSDDGDASDAALGSGDAAAGEAHFLATCAACHGPDAMGVTGLGKALVDNEFVQANSDAELLEFLKTGRPASDPLNTTGVDMPPKGGNPSLSDQDLQDIVAYLRTLQ